LNEQKENQQAEQQEQQTIEEGLRAQIAELEAKLRQQQLEAEQRAAIRETKKPSERMGIGAQDAQRANVIATLGNANFGGKTPDEQLKLLGEMPATLAEVEESKKYFGAASDAALANALAKNNPARYRRLRAVAKAHKVF